ncbi:hypothetical protein BDR06DRAFT_732136 [Suillus hirtellus]|nr:hypothetical protein BDR06DRAFT_732136 [Suillus hirtellus]
MSSCPSWSVNTGGQSPCDIAVVVYSSCPNVTTNNAISPSSSDNFLVPVSSNATLCTCSWASYNLISACTYCATGSPSLVSWDTWITNCNGSTLTTTYFPWDEGIRLPSNASIIPYYASYDHYSNTGIGNLNGSPPISNSSSSGSQSSSSSSATPIGSIVGGVVGGTVLLLLLCGFFFFIICRKRRRAAQFPHKMTLPTLNGYPQTNEPPFASHRFTHLHYSSYACLAFGASYHPCVVTCWRCS